MERISTLPLQKTKVRRKYTLGEEIFNVVTHALGTLFGIFILVYGIVRSIINEHPLGIAASIVFGASMIITYGISSVYHGLKPNTGKRVLQVIDHCTVYILIMGTYTAVMLAGVMEYAPVVALIILGIEGVLGIAAITLTAIDMKKFQIFSMICYIVLGWCLITVPHIMVGAIGLGGFMWLLGGGIAYTVGSILYGIGKKKRYMHSVFHIFCVVGSVCQFISFAVYCI